MKIDPEHLIKNPIHTENFFFELAPMDENTLHDHPSNDKKNSVLLSQSRNIVMALSVILSLGASIKQWAGSESFFQKYTGKNWASLLGFFSAIAPAAFYYTHNEVIFTQIGQFLKKIKTESYPIQLPLHDETHQSLLFVGYFFQIIFGIGHAASAYGMVYSSFPTKLDQPILKEMILTCLSISNFCFGTDKAKKVIDDSSFFYEIFFSKEANIAKKENKFIFDILVKYEELISYSCYEDAATYRQALKTGLVNKHSFSDISKVLLLNLNALQIEATHPAHKKNIYFSSRFNSNQYCMKSFRYFLWILCLSVLLANALYYIAGVPGVVSGLNVPLPFAYFLCILGSISSWGQNKIYADFWKNHFLIWCGLEKTIFIQSSTERGDLKKHCLKLWTPINFLGSTLAILQASSGVFFVEEALNFLNFLNLSGNIEKYMLRIFCMMSVGLMLTAAKAEPTIYLLKAWWEMLQAKRCCKPVQPTSLEEKIVDCFDHLIENILYLMQSLHAREDACFDQNYGIVDQINLKIQQIIQNKENGHSGLRMELCSYLLDTYTELKKNGGMGQSIIKKFKAITDPVIPASFQDESKENQSASTCYARFFFARTRQNQILDPRYVAVAQDNDLTTAITSLNTSHVTLLRGEIRGE